MRLLHDRTLMEHNEREKNTPLLTIVSKRVKIEIDMFKLKLSLFYILPFCL